MKPKRGLKRSVSLWVCFAMGSLVMVAIASTAGCGATGHGRPVRPSEEVVAELDGQPIYAEEVRAYLEPEQPWVGSVPPPDPRRRALDEAIRVRLFAREAKHRGLEASDGPPAVVQAELVQALIRQESQRSDARAGAISDAEAKRYYENNLELFNRVGSIRLAAVVVKDSKIAEQLLERAEGSSEEEFAKLANDYSVDEGSKARDGLFAVLHHDGNAAVDDEIARVGMLLREPGRVGLARGSDGRYYVLRAAEVEMQKEPWTEESKLRVKNVMAYKRERQALDELEERLRESSRIYIHEAALGKV